MDQTCCALTLRACGMLTGAASEQQPAGRDTPLLLGQSGGPYILATVFKPPSRVSLAGPEDVQSSRSTCTVAREQLQLAQAIGPVVQVPLASVVWGAGAVSYVRAPVLALVPCSGHILGNEVLGRCMLASSACLMLLLDDHGRTLSRTCCCCRTLPASWSSMRSLASVYIQATQLQVGLDSKLSRKAQCSCMPRWPTAQAIPTSRSISEQRHAAAACLSHKPCGCNRCSQCQPTRWHLKIWSIIGACSDVAHGVWLWCRGLCLLPGAHWAT
jgi:hypothetical protein